MRPPLVQAACAYCLISLIDPATYVSQGLLTAITSIDGTLGGILIDSQSSMKEPNEKKPVNGA